MTKKEHEAIQKEFNRIEEIRQKADEYFKMLQDKNGAITGTRWCSALNNYQDLAKADPDQEGRYRHWYEEYLKYRAMEDAYMEFGSTLAEAGFWKKNKR